MTILVVVPLEGKFIASLDLNALGNDYFITMSGLGNKNKNRKLVKNLLLSPLTLHLMSDKVTSFTGLLFGGERI